jgi:hypothetical protein
VKRAEVFKGEAAQVLVGENSMTTGGAAGVGRGLEGVIAAR